MTYYNNIPQGNQRISTTQPLIQSNFGYIDTAMKVDHAWNGNEINGQADGTHQKISLPNQGADIAALPTGIDTIMYAIGGNLFAYNGAKQAVSAIKGFGKLTTTSNSYQTLITLPSNCVGFIFGNNQSNISISQRGTIFYTTTEATLTIKSCALDLGGGAFRIDSNNLQYLFSSGIFYEYQYIYWPL